MNLPNATLAIVGQRKIVAYLLNPDHPDNGGKADFFTYFGFTTDEWQRVAAALIAHAQAHPVSSLLVSPYGGKYRIDGPLECPNGRSPSVRAVWIVNRGTDVPRLVTAHPF
jgi:hypothetical protein